MEEKTTKKWCRHITWTDNCADRYLTIEYGWFMNINGQHTEVPKSWKVCPICQTEKPTRANINAANLRFAMDNDQ